MSRRRRAPNRVSGTNSTRMAQNGNKWQLFGGLLCHLARPGSDPERGFLGMGRAEIIRAQTIHTPSLVSVRFRPSPANLGPLDRGCRIAPFDRDNHASKARTSEGEVVQSSHSRRKVDLPKAFHSDHLAPTGERSAAGRVRGSRRSAQQKPGACRSRPSARSKLTLHQPTRCAPPAHSVPIYYNGVFLKFRTCTYAVRGMKFDRNILSRMDLKFSEEFYK